MLVNSVTDGFLSDLRAGATKFVRLESIGPEVEEGQDFRITIDVAVKFEEPRDEAEEGMALSRRTFSRPTSDNGSFRGCR